MCRPRRLPGVRARWARADPAAQVGLSPGQEKVLGAAGMGAAGGGRAMHLYDVHRKLEATNRGSHCDSEN